VRDLCFNSGGTKLYVVGDFSTAGTAACAGFGKYEAGAWAAIQTAGKGSYCIERGPDGKLWVGNGWLVGTTGTWGVRIYNPATGTFVATYAAAYTGGDASVRALAFGPDGTLYATGQFTTLGTLVARHVARYRGAVWGTWDDTLTGDDPVQCVWPLTNGDIWLASLGSSLAVDDLLRYSGGKFTAIGVKLPTTAAAPVYSLAQRSDGTVFVGFGTSGTATAEGKTTVTVAQRSPVYPRLIVTVTGGTAPLLCIRNASTGRALYFNYTLADGETVTVDLTPGAKAIQSSFNGTILNALLPSSDWAVWRLENGANDIHLSCPSVAGTVAAYLQYVPAYWGVDGASA